jgi:hypothetical protein
VIGGEEECWSEREVEGLEDGGPGLGLAAPAEVWLAVGMDGRLLVFEVRLPGVDVRSFCEYL